MWQSDGSMKMITDDEQLKELKKRAYVPGLFHVGQVLEINQAWFRVQSINPKGMRLKSIAKPETPDAANL